ncbi:MAG: hypothetical protein NZ929_04660 [Aigarchaeota archaeon]|nr:hypothetical protein [Aigarchaeota archaeon]MDW7986700.1 hypothetical protein [Nitrososphaerota archaeon]
MSLAEIIPPQPPPWLDPSVYLSNLGWVLLRTLLTFLLIFFIGLGSLRLLDYITPGISEISKIRGNPIAVGMFAAGFFIYLSFAYIASMISPLPIGTTTGIVEGVSPLVLIAYKLITLFFGILVSLLFAFVYYRILAKLEPYGVDLDDVDKEPIAVGIYLMGYLIFLGAIVYVSLLLPVV